MKVKDLVNKCGLSETKFEFHEGSKVICKTDMKNLYEHQDGEIMIRTIGSYRVKNELLEVYLKY